MRTSVKLTPNGLVVISGKRAYFVPHQDFIKFPPLRVIAERLFLFLACFLILLALFIGFQWLQSKNSRFGYVPTLPQTVAWPFIAMISSSFATGRTKICPVGNSSMCTTGKPTATWLHSPKNWGLGRVTTSTVLITWTRIDPELPKENFVFKNVGAAC